MNRRMSFHDRVLPGLLITVRHLVVSESVCVIKGPAVPSQAARVMARSVDLSTRQTEPKQIGLWVRTRRVYGCRADTPLFALRLIDVRLPMLRQRLS